MGEKKTKEEDTRTFSKTAKMSTLDGGSAAKGAQQPGR